MKLLCKLFGHRWRMIGWKECGNDERSSTVTGWYCDRCKDMDLQQWDWP